MNNTQQHSYGQILIVCEHVANNTHPFLLAIRNEPLDPEDSGWQILCNSGLDELTETAEVWTIRHLLDFEPGFGEFIELPVGTYVSRNDSNSPWRVI